MNTDRGRQPLELSIDDYKRVLDQVSRLSVEWFEKLDERRIQPPVSGAEAQALLGGGLPDVGEGMAALDSLHEVLANARAQNGRFLGYVMGSGEMVAAVADLLASVINQNTSAWHSSPTAVTIERGVVSSLASAVGLDGFRGNLTGGGSASNLMGLAMAREAKLGANESGISAGSGAVVYASTEVHMAMPKAMALLGLGRRQLRLIAVDAAFRMRVDLLEKAIARDLAEGRCPIAVVGSAGTIVTGAIDPLEEIAAVARRFGLWFHVDGAYGGLAAIAVPDKLRGLRHVDSVALDAHKWLYQPVDCSCLLYHDADAARHAFSFTDDYAKALADDPIEAFAFFDESIELSRRFRALKLWLSWKFHGLDTFRAAIQRDLDHAQMLAEAIRDQDSLELLAPVELSAVCFRSIDPKGSADLNAFNAAVLKRINADGLVYLSNATIHGQFALRACFTNHRTTDDDIDEVVRAVTAAARAS